jgi:putative ABC transport system permease protein
MTWIAWKMLIGNRAKYLGIVFGVMFAALLIAQQSSIFCGLMLMTTSQIYDLKGANIWVMDPNVQFVDDIKPMSDNDVYRVRGVEGVEWAVRLYKGLARARLDSGNFQQMILLGLDDGTFVGAPQEMIVGTWDDLRRPDALIIDDAGYKQLWPGEPYEVGRVFEMNDRRGVVVGVCKASRTFQTFPIVYTRYSQAVQFAPADRKVLSFVLADPEPGVSAEEVCRRIEAQTGLQAETRQQFIDKTIDYYL